MANDPFTSMALSGSSTPEPERSIPAKLQISFGSIFWPVLLAQLAVGVIAAVLIALSRS